MCVASALQWNGSADDGPHDATFDERPKAFSYLRDDAARARSFRDGSGIWAAGGRAELHVWPGGIHAFDREVPKARISRAAVAARHNWLERLLATG
jgi:acetyl esterase/lipase